MTAAQRLTQNTLRRLPWALIFRIFTAVVGGYLFASALAVFFAKVFPAWKGEAVAYGLILAFAYWTLAILWVFAQRSLWRGLWPALAKRRVAGGRVLAVGGGRRRGMSVLKLSLRQAMTPVHTWGGLVLGWLLYFMFVTGTLGYFDTEIDQWMQPEIPRQQAAPGEALGIAESWLKLEAPGADRWFIGLPGSREHPNLKVFWNYSAPTGRPRAARRRGFEYGDRRAPCRARNHRRSDLVSHALQSALPAQNGGALSGRRCQHVHVAGDRDRGHHS